MAEVLTNGELTNKKFKKTFGVNIEVFDFNRITDGKTNGTRQVYKVSNKCSIPPDGKKTDLIVGILPTERFYFLFPWNECENNRTLDFGKLKGLMEIAHGQREGALINHSPFQPPVGNWKIHWVCPHGSVAKGVVNAHTLTSRIFGTSNIEIDIDKNKSDHFYYGENLLTTNKGQCQDIAGKFLNQLKYISGTASNRNKIMNYELDKFKTGKDFAGHFKNGVGLVQCSKNIGMVITRNRKLKNTNLEELLKSIKKWGFPTNLVFSSCRYIEPEKTWEESRNEGPMAFVELQGSVELPKNEAIEAKGDKVTVPI